MSAKELTQAFIQELERIETAVVADTTSETLCQQLYLAKRLYVYTLRIAIYEEYRDTEEIKTAYSEFHASMGKYVQVILHEEVE